MRKLPEKTEERKVSIFFDISMESMVKLFINQKVFTVLDLCEITRRLTICWN